MATFATDVSYYQRTVGDAYPHRWIIYRACDGTFRDPKFDANNAWARKAAVGGRITGHTAYIVFRPGVDVLSVVKAMVGVPDPHLTVMIDVESWGGEIRGNHSAAITSLANGCAAWLGDQRRVLAYGNQGDLANIYPHRPSWLRLIVASYGSQQPNLGGLIGWQYSDGSARYPVPAGYPRSSAPFGACDHNVFPDHTPETLAETLGVGDTMTPEQVNTIVANQFSRFFADTDDKGVKHDHKLVTWLNGAIAPVAANVNNVLTRTAGQQKAIDALTAEVASLAGQVAALRSGAVEIAPTTIPAQVVIGGVK